MIFQKENMTQVTTIASPVRIALVTNANIYTDAQGSVLEEVLTMAEYIEREAIMEFPIRKDRCDKEHANEHFIFGIESVLEYVENLPSADVAPVVRCQDCAHLYGTLCTVCGLLPQPDDFCSHGERREEAGS